jgi:DNA polymerase III subunit epsilon
MESRKPIQPWSLGLSNFVALDFETADRGFDSACALALVQVKDGAIVRREHHLIRPPRSHFEFTWVHGITWDDVSSQPTFSELWPKFEAFFTDTTCLVAHNVGFDRSVLRACCGEAGLQFPELNFQCTMKIARQVWRIFPTKLPNVCAHLGLTLKHHDALSDAEACARIMMAALSTPALV